jgi:hypothetical protein
MSRKKRKAKKPAGAKAPAVLPPGDVVAPDPNSPEVEVDEDLDEDEAVKGADAGDEEEDDIESDAGYRPPPLTEAELLEIARADLVDAPPRQAVVNANGTVVSDPLALGPLALARFARLVPEIRADMGKASTQPPPAPSSGHGDPDAVHGDPDALHESLHSRG